jgi:hypothetical protein
MAVTAFGRQMKIIIGAPQRNIAEHYISTGADLTQSPLIQETKVDATTIPAGKIVNISNISPNPKRGFYFKMETTRGGSEGGSSNERTVIELANLNEDTLGILHTENSQIQVWLGYESDNSLDLYYSGDIYDIQPKKNGEDIIYSITAKDGFVDNKNTRVSLHYDETMSVKDILTDLVKRFPSGSIGTMALDYLNTEKIVGGKSIQGILLKEFDRLCKSYGVSYFRYNGKYNLQPYQLIDGTPEYLLIGQKTYNIPPKSVLVLDPIIQNGAKYYDNTNIKRGVQLTTFLSPIELGQFFTIPPETSKTLAGTYKVTTIKIEADFYGEPWFVTVRGEPM